MAGAFSKASWLRSNHNRSAFVTTAIATELIGASCLVTPKNHAASTTNIAVVATAHDNPTAEPMRPLTPKTTPVTTDVVSRERAAMTAATATTTRAPSADPIPPWSSEGFAHADERIDWYVRIATTWGSTTAANVRSQKSVRSTARTSTHARHDLRFGVVDYASGRKTSVCHSAGSGTSPGSVRYTSQGEPAASCSDSTAHCSSAL